MELCNKYTPNNQDEAKTKSRDYFNTHRKSRLAHGGYLLLNDLDCITPIRSLANIFFPRLKAGDVKMYYRRNAIGRTETENLHSQSNT